MTMARLWAGTLLAVLSASGPAMAQARKSKEQAAIAPREAATIVVAVTSYFHEERTPEIGAGIIVGVKGTELYVATAGHVVRRDTVATAIWVKFVGGDSVKATVVRQSPDSLFDLALLSVSGDPAHLNQWTPRSWDRQGSIHSLQSDDPVSPVGCPQGQCWRAPRPPDRVIGKLESSIIFQSFFVRRGSSGGALFNRWWEVVGMVTKDEPPLGNAIPIDTVLAQVEHWGFPIALKQPPVPRGGYRTTVGAVVMTSTSSASSTGDTRAPSGRVSLVRQIAPWLSWHVSGLRLAPKNLAITAAMAGLTLHKTTGRLAVAPFVEAGVGHVESRYNLGSYYVAAGGSTQPVPVWNRVVKDGLGVGAGMNVAVAVFPPTAIEITAGYWGFTRPDSAAKLNKLFVGAGMRLGL